MTKPTGARERQRRCQENLSATVTLWRVREHIRESWAWAHRYNDIEERNARLAAFLVVERLILDREHEAQSLGVGAGDGAAA